MPPKLFQRATADGYAAEAETAKERLGRLEREYKIKQEKAKRRAKNSGPNLRWKPPVVERLDPTQDAVWRAVVEAPVENEDDDHELMYVLNKNEPEINFTYCGQTPFFYACNHGKVGVVKLLLRWPHPTELDVNQRSDGGETPFLAACRGDHLGVVKVLLETGPKASPLLEDLDPNQKANDGRSALWCAAHKGHVRTLKWLLENCGVGRLDWEAAADGLEGFDPPRKVTCLQAAKAMARGDDVLKIVKQGVSKQRRQRARDRMRRAQKATKASVRMRDADGVFFGTDIYDSSNLDDLNREKHDLGNQKGIDYGGRTAATDELNAKAAAAQGGGDNKALAMFGGGKKKSPFG